MFCLPAARAKTMAIPKANALAIANMADNPKLLTNGWVMAGEKNCPKKIALVMPPTALPRRSGGAVEASQPLALGMNRPTPRPPMSSPTMVTINKAEEETMKWLILKVRNTRLKIAKNE